MTIQTPFDIPAPPFGFNRASHSYGEFAIPLTPPWGDPATPSVGAIAVSHSLIGYPGVGFLRPYDRESDSCDLVMVNDHRIPTETVYSVVDYSRQDEWYESFNPPIPPGNPDPPEVFEGTRTYTIAKSDAGNFLVDKYDTVGDPPTLIVFDTFAQTKATGGKEEYQYTQFNNDDEAVGTVYCSWYLWTYSAPVDRDWLLAQVQAAFAQFDFTGFDDFTQGSGIAKSSLTESDGRRSHVEISRYRPRSRAYVDSGDRNFSALNAGAASEIEVVRKVKQPQVVETYGGAFDGYYATRATGDAICGNKELSILLEVPIDHLYISPIGVVDETEPLTSFPLSSGAGYGELSHELDEVEFIFISKDGRRYRFEVATLDGSEYIEVGPGYAPVNFDRDFYDIWSFERWDERTEEWQSIDDVPPYDLIDGSGNSLVSDTVRIIAATRAKTVEPFGHNGRMGDGRYAKRTQIESGASHYDLVEVDYELTEISEYDITTGALKPLVETVDSSGGTAGPWMVYRNPVDSLASPVTVVVDTDSEYLATSTVPTVMPHSDAYGTYEFLVRNDGPGGRIKSTTPLSTGALTVFTSGSTDWLAGGQANMPNPIPGEEITLGNIKLVSSS